MPVKFFSLLLVGALALPALAQESTPTPPPTSPVPTATEPAPTKRHKPRFGAEVGFFRFNSSRTGDTFGGNGISISPAYGTIRSATRKGKLRSDISFNFSRSNGNTLIFAPLGARYIVGLSDKANQPYVGVSLNAVPVYTKIDTLGQGGKFKVGVGGSAFAGYNFGDKYNVEARYFQISKVRGFDLSHFEISAGIRF